MTYRFERLDIEGYPGGIGRITLTRPERLNALSIEGFTTLAALFRDISNDKSLRAVILTGEGRGFCAGADLASLAGEFGSDPGGGIAPERMRGHFDASVNALLRAMLALPQPLICAVNGIASGGGVGLALAGDMVIAHESAAFHLPFGPNLGIVPDAGASWMIARSLGRGRALPLMLSGQPIPARKALDWGLVWEVLPEADFAAGVLAHAARLATLPRAVIAASRDVADQGPRISFDQGLELEREINSELVASADFVEGVNAFRAKRPPVFG